jgi:hypothetical protein
MRELLLALAVLPLVACSQADVETWRQAFQQGSQSTSDNQSTADTPEFHLKTPEEFQAMAAQECTAAGYTYSTDAYGQCFETAMNQYREQQIQALQMLGDYAKSQSTNQLEQPTETNCHWVNTYGSYEWRCTTY